MDNNEITNDSAAQAEKLSPLKNVRANPDVENFYRFIYENNLRKEAKLCLEAVVKALKPAKKTRGRRKKKLQ